MSDILGQDEKIVIVICNNCKHNLGGGRCKAFEERIPDEIFSGKNNHSKPLSYQLNDIVFDPKNQE